MGKQLQNILENLSVCCLIIKKQIEMAKGNEVYQYSNLCR